MAEPKEARNKALVLKAFNTLFNERDYAAAERLWSAKYIQHCAHIAPGRDALFDLIKSIPPTLKYQPGTEKEFRYAIRKNHNDFKTGVPIKCPGNRYRDGLDFVNPR